MKQLPTIGAALAAIAMSLAACAPAHGPRDEPPPMGTDPIALEPPGSGHVRLPLENVRDVMHAKLAHAHGLLEGIALADFDQVRSNAEELSRLSEEAGWRVHTTPAYGVFSEEFRVVVDQLAVAATREDMEAVLSGYLQMTRACVRCHSYMRREGLYRDVPGAVSLRSPAAEDRDPDR